MVCICKEKIWYLKNSRNSKAAHKQCIHHADLLSRVLGIVRKVQSNLQVQSSLARAVTVDNEVATNSRTLHMCAEKQ